MTARFASGLVLLVLACATAPAPTFAADTVETATKSVDDWVKLRLEAARLDTTWHDERALLEAMAVALEERAAVTEEKRELVRARTARAREEASTLRGRWEAEQADVQAMDARLKAMAERLGQLRRNLPPRVSDALEMSYRSLANPSLPPAERFQLTMTVLNRCLEFNRSVAVVEDVLTIPGQPAPRSLPVLYWGLAQGYALDAPNRQVWVGAPEGGAWRWQPRPQAYAAVETLLQIARDKADPGLHPLPLTVGKFVAEGGEAK